MDKTAVLKSNQVTLSDTDSAVMAPGWIQFSETLWTVSSCPHPPHPPLLNNVLPHDDDVSVVCGQARVQVLASGDVCHQGVWAASCGQLCSGWRRGAWWRRGLRPETVPARETPGHRQQGESKDHINTKRHQCLWLCGWSVQEGWKWLSDSPVFSSSPACLSARGRREQRVCAAEPVPGRSMDPGVNRHRETRRVM